MQIFVEGEYPNVNESFLSSRLNPKAAIINREMIISLSTQVTDSINTSVVQHGASLTTHLYTSTIAEIL